MGWVVIIRLTSAPPMSQGCSGNDEILAGILSKAPYSLHIYVHGNINRDSQGLRRTTSGVIAAAIRRDV
jgi:hypothetical protein